tara:strand:+ start:229 stop:1002 length:774 start_codon:yes stop_codon:yes gene_type:complete
MMQRKKILITGTSSGIGRYLKEKLHCESFCRSNSGLLKTSESYDAIIHCAFNMKRLEEDKNFYQYIEDTLSLTRSLTEIDHKLFIFISSIDVYPTNNLNHKETEIINPNELSGIYPIFKLACESIVRKKSKNLLILRPGMLLGSYMRPNNLTQILSGKSTNLSLSEISSYHCILYEDILSTIQYALDFSLTGIYNAVRSEKVSIKSLGDFYNTNLKFGKYDYCPENINNVKISNLIPSFKKTSLEAIEEFISVNKIM